MLRVLVMVVVALSAIACGGLAGPGQSGVWEDGTGRQTVVDPQTGNVWFALDGAWVYGRDLQGRFFAVTPAGVSALDSVPSELAAWPGFEAAIAPSAGQSGGTQPQQGWTQPQRGGMQPQRGWTQPQQGGSQAQAGHAYPSPSQADLQIMMDMQNMQHETSMAIINNMQSDPVEYYDQDNLYIGTW